MGKFARQIRTLQTALKIKKDRIYLVSHKQVYSPRKGRTFTKTVLEEWITGSEYQRRMDEIGKKTKKDWNSIEYTKQELINSFDELDILLYLADVYKGVTEWQVIEHEREKTET